MKKKNEIRSAVLQFLANHHVVARAVSCTTGVFTRPIRETNVVMFHAGRCGSTVVGMLLNQHPRINWLGEIFARFKEKFGDGSWVWEYPEMMIEMRTNIHLCRNLGIEIKRGQIINLKMDKKRLINTLEKNEFKKYVILKRKNYLRKKLSEVVAKEIGKMNTKKSINVPKVKIPVSIGKWDVPEKTSEVETLVDHFEMLDEFYSELEKILKKKDVIEIEYEKDILEDPKKAANRILNGLGLESTEAEPKTKKMNKKPLKKSISNFEEVEKALSGTKYEWMVHEG